MSANEKIGAFSRRQFLKILSLELGLLALSGCRRASATQAFVEIIRSPSAMPPKLAPSVLSTHKPTEASLSQKPTDPPEATQFTQPTLPAEQVFLPEIREVGEVYALPQPRLPDNVSLMQALVMRRSTRTFSPGDLPVGILSDLLWAGFGVNRPESGRRTAPSARNMQDISIFVSSEDGLWRYDAQSHSLTAILADDIRPLTQPTSGDRIEAPYQLIYVSRYPAGLTASEMIPWSWAHSGFISQNVYLYCAATDLATVVRSAIEREPLAERMGLRDDEHITLVQSVGMRA